MTDLVSAALAIAERGWPVFPCDPSAESGRSKRPLIKGGFKNATTDEQQIRQWWSTWPKALIGVQIMTGTKLLHVPYKSSPQAIVDLIAGRVQLMFDNLPSIAPHIKAGKLIGLGQTGSVRSKAMPELPTIAEAGVPGFEILAWSGVIVPAGVPKAIVARLNAEVNKALASPSLREQFDAVGYEITGNSTPEQFAEFVRKETEKWAYVVKRSGAKNE